MVGVVVVVVVVDVFLGGVRTIENVVKGRCRRFRASQVDIKQMTITEKKMSVKRVMTA